MHLLTRLTNLSQLIWIGVNRPSPRAASLLTLDSKPLAASHRRSFDQILARFFFANSKALTSSSRDTARRWACTVAMSTFRRNFLCSALKPPLRDSTQCLEVDGILDLRAGGPHRPGTISSGLTRTCMAARGFVFFCCCLSLGFGVFSDRGGGTEEEEGTARVLGAWQCAWISNFCEMFHFPATIRGFLDAPMRPAGQLQVNLGCHAMGPSFSETCND